MLCFVNFFLSFFFFFQINVYQLSPLSFTVHNEGIVSKMNFREQVFMVDICRSGTTDKSF